MICPKCSNWIEPDHSNSSGKVEHICTECCWDVEAECYIEFADIVDISPPHPDHDPPLTYGRFGVI